MITPTTPAGLQKYDHQDAVQAAINAWMNPGPYGEWHEMMKVNVRQGMPLLARALDRLSREAR